MNMVFKKMKKVGAEIASEYTAAADDINRTMLYDTSNVIAELKKNADRYEKIRKLTPLQFSSLYQRNLEFGVLFDELVDNL